MITKRKLNKKLDLLIHRQNLLATVVFKTQLNHAAQQRAQKRWNDLWRNIMEEKGE